MALSADLQRIASQSSGLYRILIDQSQVVSQTSSQTRLVIGFSKQGPFNTPVFCPDSQFFRSVFGDIDRGLERKGSFFHRSCLTALEEGPIYALNLLTVNDELGSGNEDLVDYVALSTSSTETNGSNTSLLLSQYYNKEKFWFPDPDVFLNNLGANNKMLNISNIGKKPISVLARKSDLGGFDVTAREWYGVGNVPDFMNESDFISDYMVDVIVVEGDFTDYNRLAADPVFGAYFDSLGLKKDTTAEFIGLPEVNLLGIYQGTLIPDFTDQNGTPLYIETLINQDSSRTGLFVTIDQDRFDDEVLSGDGIDLIGHKVEYDAPTSVNFLSYSGAIATDQEFAPVAINTANEYTTAGDLTVETSNEAGRKNVIRVQSTNGDFATIRDSVTLDSYVKGIVTVEGDGTLGQSTSGAYYLPVTNITTTATDVYITVNDYGYATTESNIAIDDAVTASNVEFIFNPDYLLLDATATDIYRTPTSSVLGEAIAANQIVTGDIIIEDDAPDITHYIQISQATDASGFEVYEIASYTTNTFITQQDVPAFGDTLDSNDVLVATNINIQSLKGSLNVSVPATATGASNVVRVDNTGGTYTGTVQVGDFLVSFAGDAQNPSRLTRVTSVVSVDANTLEITALDAIDINGGNIERYKSIDTFFDNYTLFHLPGFTFRADQMPNNTNSRMNDIYGVMSATNVKAALIDKELISFRYIVDTFNHGIEAGSKAVLFELARDRENAITIANMPKYSEFMDSTDPRFRPAATTVNPYPTVETSFISTGGNLTLNPNVVYSLPGTSAGAAYGGFYGPNLLINERSKNVSVPPAAYISNLFVRKWKDAFPWSIVAGPGLGSVSGRGLAGVEYNFSKTDRDNLEPFGLNLITIEGGAPVIQSNQTAQQKIKTSLSKLNGIEVVIYIMDGIANILRNYKFKFNTPQSRLEIKTLADQFMETVLSGNGVVFFENIMNRDNNTSDVINSDMGVLDTYIITSRGFEKLAHRTTLFANGSVQTGELL